MPRDNTETDRAAALQEAIDAARDHDRLRDRALTLAVQQFNKTRLSVNGEQITALAGKFYTFLKGA